MIRPAALLVLLCAAACAWSADRQQVYKWTDANGVVHFTDTPPPRETKDVQALHLIGGTTAAAEPAAADDKPKDAANPAQTGATAAADADQAALCKQAHANLELLQSNTPVGIPGPDGKATTPIDDKTRQGQIASATLAVSRYCK